MKKLFSILIFFVLLFSLSCSVNDKINFKINYYYRTHFDKTKKYYDYTYIDRINKKKKRIECANNKREQFFSKIDLKLDSLQKNDSIYYIEGASYSTTQYLIKYKNDFYDYVCFDYNLKGKCDSIVDVTKFENYNDYKEYFLELKKNKNYNENYEYMPTFLIIIKNNKVELIK